MPSLCKRRLQPAKRPLGGMTHQDALSRSRSPGPAFGSSPGQLFRRQQRRHQLFMASEGPQHRGPLTTNSIAQGNIHDPLNAGRSIKPPLHRTGSAIGPSNEPSLSIVAAQLPRSQDHLRSPRPRYWSVRSNNPAASRSPSFAESSTGNATRFALRSRVTCAANCSSRSPPKSSEAMWPGYENQRPSAHPLLELVHSKTPAVR